MSSAHDSNVREHSPSERAQSLVRSFQTEEDVRHQIEREVLRDEPRQFVLDALEEQLEVVTE